MKTQRCGRCKQSLALSKFSPSKRGKSGKWCIACFKEYRQRMKWASAKPNSAGQTKQGLWSMSLFRRPRPGGALDDAVVVFACDLCKEVVEPVLRDALDKFQVDARGVGTVKLGLYCSHCHNGTVMKMALHPVGRPWWTQERARKNSRRSRRRAA
jgi:hypothetical protein